MKRFIKPSGTEVMVNENSEQAAIEMGWKPVESETRQESVPEVVETSDEPRQKRKYTRRNV